MTAETIEVVNPQMASETAGAVVFGGTAVTVSAAITADGTVISQPDQIRIRTWTAVTETRPADQPPGTPALLAIEGVNRALHVRIHYAEEGVALIDVDTGVFGTGDTLLEAMQDLRDALHAHLAVLAEEDALAPSLQSQLEILRSYFNIP